MRIRNNKVLLKLILKKSKQISKALEKKNPRRGRPKLYHTHIIITTLLLKVLKSLSLRELEEELKKLFPKAPDFTSLRYRFKKLESQHLHKLIRQTAEEIMKKLKAKECYCLIADGTGFGYADTIKQNRKKGKELREVKTHVKTEVLVGVVRNKAFVVGVNTGIAYADENSLLMPMLENLNIRARYFLADAYYGKSVKVLKKVKELSILAIVPVKDTTHMKVKDPYRLWAKENYQQRRRVYRKRYIVEQVIAKAKNSMGDRDRTKDFHIASLYVLARFVLLNLALIAVGGLFCGSNFGYFSNRLSCSLDEMQNKEYTLYCLAIAKLSVGLERPKLMPVEGRIAPVKQEAPCYRVWSSSHSMRQALTIQVERFLGNLYSERFKCLRSKALGLLSGNPYFKRFSGTALNPMYGHVSTD